MLLYTALARVIFVVAVVMLPVTGCRHRHNGPQPERASYPEAACEYAVELHRTDAVVLRINGTERRTVGNTVFADAEPAARAKLLRAALAGQAAATPVTNWGEHSHWWFVFPLASSGQGNRQPAPVETPEDLVSLLSLMDVAPREASLDEVRNAASAREALRICIAGTMFYVAKTNAWISYFPSEPEMISLTRMFALAADFPPDGSDSEIIARLEASYLFSQEPGESLAVLMNGQRAGLTRLDPKTPLLRAALKWPKWYIGRDGQLQEAEK